MNSRLLKSDIAVLLILTSFTIGCLVFMAGLEHPNGGTFAQSIESRMPFLGFLTSIVLMGLIPITSLGTHIRLSTSRPFKFFAFISLSLMSFLYVAVMWPFWTQLVIGLSGHPDLDHFYGLSLMIAFVVIAPLWLASLAIGLGLSILTLLAVLRRSFATISHLFFPRSAVPDLPKLAQSTLRWWIIFFLISVLAWVIRLYRS